MSARGPAAADLQTALGRQLELLTERLRGYRPDDWAAASADDSESNAATVAHLVAGLSGCARGVEARGAGAPPEPEPQEVGDDERLAGLLSATGDHLLEVLGETEATDPVWHAGRRIPARLLAAATLAEVVLHGWDLTGPGERGPEPRPARLVLQGLFAAQDDSGVNPAALLLHLSGRRQLEGHPGWRGPEWRWELETFSIGGRSRS